MAFQNNRLTVVTATMGSTLFHYSSEEDTLSTVVADGYFNGAVDEGTPRASQIKRGDTILATGTDTADIVTVISDSGVVPLVVA